MVQSFTAKGKVATKHPFPYIYVLYFRFYYVTVRKHIYSGLNMPLLSSSLWSDIPTHEFLTYGCIYAFLAWRVMGVVETQLNQPVCYVLRLLVQV